MAYIIMALYGFFGLERAPAVTRSGFGSEYKLLGYKKKNIMKNWLDMKN